MVNNKCIRILRIVSVMDMGGIESQIMNIYRKIDKSRFQFDFLVTRNKIGVFDKEIEELGGRIYRISGVKEVGFVKYALSINYFFRKHREYKIVHCHMNTWSGLFLNIAKWHKIPIRIAQSHSAQKQVRSSNLKEFLHKSFKSIMKQFIKYGATHYWSVGKEAGQWLFGNKTARDEVKILPNAKDLNQHKFSSQNRNLLKKSLNIPDSAFVIGHVGSFNDVKNHSFLIDIFIGINKNYKNCYLCLVGDGPLKEKIEKKASINNIIEKVLFLGFRSDVNKLMSVFDVLVLPSKFEGIPNVLIEAQISGLPCIVSNSIPNEVDLNLKLIEFISLNDKTSIWEEKIISSLSKQRQHDTIIKIDPNYNIDNLVNWLQDFYLDTWENYSA
jgi:glycosyltransferase involved in cell wall biosynthesis